MPRLTVKARPESRTEKVNAAVQKALTSCDRVLVVHSDHAASIYYESAPENGGSEEMK